MRFEATRMPSVWAAYPRQSAAVLVLVLGLATIAGAWAFQLIGGYVPCALCLQERIPYYVGLPLVLLGLILGPWPWPSRAALFLAAITFILGAGVEWGWWAGPAACAVPGGTLGGNAGDLMERLQNIHVVSCTEASWRFPGFPWGLSFAGWNAVISAVLALAALWGALAMKRRGYGSSSVSQ
jgi:disulfide bond formation protein DsbB